MVDDVTVGFGEVGCAVCERHPAVWLRHLDEERSRFRVYGKGHTWGSPVPLCAACDDLVSEGDVDALVTTDPASQGLAGPDLVERVSNGYSALIGATVRRQSVGEATPPGWQQALVDGFTPMEQITGSLHLVHGWPEAHRRSIDASDTSGYLPDGRHWFIRSPWPSVDLERLWFLVVTEVEAGTSWGDGALPDDFEATEAAVVRALTTLDEAEIHRRLG